MSLADISQEVVSCTKCGLAESRTHAVPGEGNPRAEIMFIGEGPGQREDEQGRPFVGPAGRLLDQLLDKINIKREDVFIANVIKCRPPGNRDPLPEEAEACWPYLEQQIREINPKLIILLGRHALERFVPGKKISAVRGKPLRREIPHLGRLVFYPIFHPAAALHQPRFMEDLEADFMRIPKVIAKVDELARGKVRTGISGAGPEQKKLL